MHSTREDTTFWQVAAAAAAEPVAIVGVGAVLPGARTAAEFWERCLSGKVALRGPRAAAVAPEPHAAVGDRPARREAGWLLDEWVVDWKRFRLPPAETSTINPLQFATLEAGMEALATVRNLPRATTAVILGATGLGFQKDSGLRVRTDEMMEALRASPAFAALPEEQRAAIESATARTLDTRLKPSSNDNSVGSLASVAAARISAHLDLLGPHYGVDADHASALAALELAVLGLRSGEWDCVVTGGVSELVTPAELLCYERMGLLSPTGQVAPFDAQADGMLLGEGVALVCLKRLRDARRDGDRVYAVIEGIGVCGGGAEDGQPTPTGEAPAPSAIVGAIRAAHAQAAIDPLSVDAVECEAPGVASFDEAEASALAQVFSRRDRPLWLGSTKANIGHLRAAAGAAALVRTALALHHRTLPPQPGASVPAFWLAPAGFVLPSKPMAWPASAEPGAPARAGVTAVSLAGQCYHAVLAGLDEATLAVAPEAPSGPAMPPEANPHPSPPLAITGMGGVFAGSSDLDGFFRDLLEGKDQVRDVPAERFRLETFYSSTTDRREKSYARMGSFIELPSAREDERDAEERAAVDPTHRVLVRAAEQAIAEAGGRRWAPERVRTFVAFMPFQARKFLAEARANYVEFAAALEGALAAGGIEGDAADGIVLEAEAGFKAALPKITSHSLPGWLGGMGAVRVARRFGFTGAACGVESACASMLAALHAASEALAQGLCDAAIVGGGWADIAPEFFVATCRFNGLSPAGIRPFGSDASGFVPGEGAGVFVLRRLEDAEREGDPIRAVLRAVSGSSDGKGRSVLTPSMEGEALAMQRALAGASLTSGEVDYVECHGTGTVLGDAVEAMSLACAYGANARTQPLLVGTVKSNLGHLIAAAGAPALAKVVLSLEHQTIPATIHCETPNPKLGFAASGIELVRAPTPWSVRADGRPRRAALSAFGIGGSNFHAIVEEHRRARQSAAVVPAPAPSPRSPLPGEQPQGRLFAFVSDSPASCVSAMARLAAGLDGASPERFAAAAKETVAAAEQRAADRPGEVRLALVAAGFEELGRNASRLAEALESRRPLALLAPSGIFLGSPLPAGERPDVTVAFTGYGSQYPRMLAELAALHPLVEETLDRADRTFAELTGHALRPSLWPAPGPAGEAGTFAPSPEEAHVAVVVVGYALHQLLSRHGLGGSLLIGQSAGELAALAAAGTLGFEDAIRAMYHRTGAVKELPPNGFMGIVSCGATDLRRILKGLRARVVVAGENSPTRSIVSGEREALDRVAARCAEAGQELTPLPLSHAYHSPLMAGAARRYREALEALPFAAPSVDVISTVDLAVYDESRAGAIDRLVRQFTSPVRLREAVEVAWSRGARVFLEAGPKWPVTGYVRETLGERPHVAHSSVHPKIGEATQLARLLACSWVAGAGRLTAAESAVTPDGAAFAPPADAEAPHGVESDILAIEEIVEAPAAASGSAATRVSSEELFEQVRAKVVSAMAARTGYPVEMLELDLDLEGDLGIDTVKQVEVLARVREELGLEREAGLSMRELSTLRKAIERFVTRLGGSVAVREGTPSVAAGSAAPPQPGRTVAPAASAAPTGRDTAVLDRVSALLVRAMAERTGYPPEMLELDLDLEGDLGIDTVKQVEVFGRVREELGLQREPGLSMRELCTLRKAAERFTRRLESSPATARAPAPAPAAAPAPPPPSFAAAPPVAAPPPAMVAEVAPVIALRTGGRPAPLPAGGASVRLERTLTRAELPFLDENLVAGQPAVTIGTLFDLVAEASIQLLGRPATSAASLMQHRLVRPAPDGRVPLRLELRQAGPGRVRGEVHGAADGGLLLSVDLGAEPSAAPEAIPESEAQRARARLAPAAQVPSGDGGGDAELIELAGQTVWARALSFCEVVGGVAPRGALPAAPKPGALAGTVLDGVAVLAGFAWYALVGRVGVAAGFESLSLLRAPGADEALSCHLRLRQAEAHRATSDVVILGADRSPVARILGLRVLAPAAFDATRRGDAGGGVLTDYFRALRDRSAMGRG